MNIWNTSSNSSNTSGEKLRQVKFIRFETLPGKAQYRIAHELNRAVENVRSCTPVQEANMERSQRAAQEYVDSQMSAAKPKDHKPDLADEKPKAIYSYDAAQTPKTDPVSKPGILQNTTDAGNEALDEIRMSIEEAYTTGAENA